MTRPLGYSAVSGGGGGGSTTTNNYPVSVAQAPIIPLYVYPSFSGSDWTTLTAAPAQSGMVIANPATGPGVTVNSDYATAITNARAAGLRVLGYVTLDIGSGPGTRAQSAVLADVDAWYSLYAVDGIFYDIAPTGANGDRTAYFQAVCDYAHSKAAGQIIVVNPGTYPLTAAYVDAADIVCVWEGDYTANSYTSFAVPGYAAAYVSSYPASKYLHLVYNVTTAGAMQAALTHAQALGVRWVYTTQATASSWNALATYWPAQVSALKAGIIPVDPLDRRNGYGALPSTAVGITPSSVIRTTVTKTANFTAPVGVLSLVDTTGGAVTATLPGGALAGQRLAVKLYAGSNPVNLAVTGTDHIGASATTAQLVLSGEIWEFVSDGNGQWNLVGGNKSLSSLDARYPKRSDLFYVVTDPAFGADPTGAVSSVTAIQAAINACPSTGGTVFFPPGTYKIDAALNIKAHLNLLGAGQVSRLNATANHLCTWTGGRLTDFSAKHLKLTVAAGGHIFSAGTNGADQCEFEKVQCVQSDPAYSIWNQDNADSYIEVHWTHCDLWMSATATVPAFNLRGTAGALNNSEWSNCRFNGQGNINVPFVRIEEYGTTYTYNNRFTAINAENCPGGIAHGYSAQGWVLNTVSHWDVLQNGANVFPLDALRFAKGSGGSSPLSRDIKVVAYKRQAPANPPTAASTTIPAGVGTTGATTYTVAATTGFPTYNNFYVTVDSETMLVTTGPGGTSTTAWTVVRGALGTTAATHSAGAAVSVTPAYDINCASAGFIDGTLSLDGCNTSGVTGISVNAKNYTAINSVGNSQLSDTQIFTSSGTWTKPIWAGPNAVTHVVCVSGGGGGGSGAVEPTGTAASGGGGGGSAGRADARIPTSALPGTVSVGVGPGGAGGAAVSATGTNGNAGGNPGQSSFGTYVLTGVNATGGGAGGTASGGTAGTGATSLVGSSGSGGAGGANGGVGLTGASGTLSGGGGGAGGITSAEAAGAGSTGRTGTSGLNTTYAGGTAPGGVGTDGASQPVNSGLVGGSGGGGGGGDATHNGGNGGAGGLYGGAGGGGGGTRNGMTSGKGGDGAAGIVIVITTP